MTGDEKAYNCNLFDQLELIERLEVICENGDITAVKDALKVEKRFIERKLHQNL